jgi:hypothetical protein
MAHMLKRVGYFSFTSGRPELPTWKARVLRTLAWKVGFTNVERGRRPPELPAWKALYSSNTRVEGRYCRRGRLVFFEHLRGKLALPTWKETEDHRLCWENVEDSGFRL